MFKKLLTCFVVVMMMVSTFTFAVLAGDATADVPKGTAVIDGVKDAIYETGAYFAVDKKFPGAAKEGGTGKAWAVWDENYLYVYMEVADTTPSYDAADAWMKDNVEFFLDLGNKKGASYDGSNDFQIRINGKGEITGTFGTAMTADDVKFKVVNDNDQANGYIIEAAFPLVGGKSEGDKIGWDISIGDGTTAAGRDAQYGWCDTSDTNYMNPSNFGTLTLVAAAPAPAATSASASKTGDASMILVISTMIASLGGLAISKKKS